ncbi:MAG TPA: helix-hairpin-helix domain-containing protein, partial [Acidobacteriota bacterium]|nr:helix-hairpin-helix domain-containing protein [Acidobacteriota bacterium]
KVSAGEVIDRDILALVRAERLVAAVALQVRDGLLIGRQDYQLAADPSESDADVLAAFIKQYYLNSPSIPDEIYLPFHFSDEELIGQWLSGERRRVVRLVFPQRGEKYALLEMALTNARLSLNELLSQKERAAVRIPDSVYQLQRDLRLAVPPRAIAAFDVSNLGATDPVGSLVFFRDAQPLKRNYRKFKIKTVVGQNDFAMIGEIVSRYFGHLVEAGEEFPDLVLIDGGVGQLRAALAALEALNVSDLPVIGLAKRLEQVVLPSSVDGDGRTLSIPRASPSLRLLQRVRDEAHRFALTFQKSRRKKRVIRSELDGIRGVGPVRRQALLERFGSVAAVGKASRDELVERGGLDRRTAETVWSHFHLSATPEGDGKSSSPHDTV